MNDIAEMQNIALIIRRFRVIYVYTHNIFYTLHTLRGMNENEKLKGDLSLENEGQPNTYNNYWTRQHDVYLHSLLLSNKMFIHGHELRKG